MFYTYILKCSDGTFYTGYTNDLKNRLALHNNKKGAKYTRGRTPVRLVYYEIFPSKSLALKKEYAIKRLSRQEKISLIKNLNLTII